MIKDFGIMGDGPKTKEVLDSSYVPPALVSQHTRDYLRACKLPSDKVITTLPRTVEQFKESWKVVNEQTSSRSIHFGHFKAALSSTTILLTHYALAEIPFCSGYIPERWKQATNIMILKKEGITDIDRLRTIVLMEADYNHNNKYLGRAMMYHSIAHNLLAKEQYLIPGKMH